MKLLLICLLYCSLAFAKTGSLSGRVVDARGDAILGANVVVIELDQIGATVMDMDSGRFVIPHVPYGLYTLRTSAVGFKTVHRSCVEVSETIEDLMIVMEIEPIDIGGGFDPYFHDSTDWYARARYDSAQFAKGAIYICGYSYELPLRYGVIEGSAVNTACEVVELKNIQLNGKLQKFELIGTDWHIGHIQPGTYRLVAKSSGCKPIVLDNLQIEAGRNYRIPAQFECK